VVLSAYTVEHFRRLCDYLGKPWMVNDPRFVDNLARVAHRDELLAEIESVLSVRSTQDCVSELSGLGLVVAAVKSYAEVLESPDVQEPALLTTGTDPHGQSYPIPFLPFALDGVKAEPGRPVPRLSETRCR
jgi:crotonobetainyl-CoA:carnitine CoA-transferase CaiB-like acyl-CoA transferase